VDRGPPVPYRVVFDGDLPPDLKGLLPQVSQAEQLAKQPPSSELVVRRRALDDVPRLQAALRSQGYYDGQVGVDLEPAAQTGAGQPQAITVRFRVESGPLYRFGERHIELTGDSGGLDAPPPNHLGLREGDPAKAQAVLDAEQALLKQARQEGHALAALGQRATVIDSDKRTMDVTLRLEPGPVARFGEVTFEGVPGIDQGFLQRRLPFKPGEVYDPEKLAKAQTKLFETQLFSTLVTEQAKQLTPDGRLPITVRATPRATRSVGATIGYQTDTGPSGSLFWEDRSLLGGGERFRVEGTLNLLLQDLHATYRKPDFLATDQSQIDDAELKREDTPAYQSLSASASAGVEHLFTEKLVGRLSLAYRYVDLKPHSSSEPEQLFGLVSLPGTLDWDFSDDLLNPTRGGRLDLFAAPYLDTLGPSREFLKLRATTTRYVRLFTKPDLVLALRGSAGSILGVSRDDIPADERFYAGGGGSVRGIPYQLAGPLDRKDEPRGGRSVLEASAELRYRITESLGAVLFLDAGSAFDSLYPDPSEGLRLGAGPGLRYYTPIGPLRLDIGVPLNPRPHVDDWFQLYLSIGQAF
jgi:translocation and assembly module TamA